jgi:CheY-like chemotaxis protein
MSQSLGHVPNILLADDDQDDCLLFEEALHDAALTIRLSIVHNGEQLMLKLKEGRDLPDLIFLDLNMPRKNGFECLSEIKQNVSLVKIPVVIFSTSFEPNVVELLYSKGAHYYICKPNEYPQLVQVVYNAITMSLQNAGVRIPVEEFVLSPESCLNEKK